jgi:DNA polymerase III epsilon subunit-like protein
VTDWTDRLIYVLDIESTGVDPLEARIVTVAFGHVGGGEASTVRTVVVAPEGFVIPEEAASIHGFSTERALEEGGSLEDALRQVIQSLEQRASDEVLVAFNARFDISILTREFDRANLYPPDITSRIVDPYVLDRWLDRYRRGSRKLEVMCDTYGVILDGAHDAGHDAVAAARLAWKMGRRGEVKRRVRDAGEGRELARLKREWEAVRHDPGLLHDLQVREAAKQAASLEGYLRAGDPKKGTPPDPTGVVDRDWPLIPLPVVVDG